MIDEMKSGLLRVAQTTSESWTTVSLVTWSTITFSSNFDRGEKVLGCFSSCLSEGE
jgi:hypothetical protein